MEDLSLSPDCSGEGPVALVQAAAREEQTQAAPNRQHRLQPRRDDRLQRDGSSTNSHQETASLTRHHQMSHWRLQKTGTRPFENHGMAQWRSAAPGNTAMVTSATVGALAFKPRPRHLCATKSSTSCAQAPMRVLCLARAHTSQAEEREKDLACLLLLAARAETTFLGTKPNHTTARSAVVSSLDERRELARVTLARLTTKRRAAPADLC
jgi:hypothetical protein